MPRKDWEAEFGPSMEEYKNNSYLQKDMTYVALQKTECLPGLATVTWNSNWE